MINNQRNRLRIIAGEWRGRILTFPDALGLRPTPNRVRETVFNWLQGVIIGAHCLDLFAGSGALSLEALSRGAAAAVLIERNPLVAIALINQLKKLGTTCGQVITADALEYLNTASRPFDIVFLDPPFHQNWIDRCCRLLAANGWLAPNALLYLETEIVAAALKLPSDFVLMRANRAGQVNYYLARYLSTNNYD